MARAAANLAGAEVDAIGAEDTPKKGIEPRPLFWRVQLIKSGKQVAVFAPRDGSLNFIDASGEPLLREAPGGALSAKPVDGYQRRVYEIMHMRQFWADNRPIWTRSATRSSAACRRRVQLISDDTIVPPSFPSMKTTRC